MRAVTCTLHSCSLTEWIRPGTGTTTEDKTYLPVLLEHTFWTLHLWRCVNYTSQCVCPQQCTAHHMQHVWSYPKHSNFYLISLNSNVLYPCWSLRLRLEDTPILLQEGMTHLTQSAWLPHHSWTQGWHSDHTSHSLPFCFILSFLCIIYLALLPIPPIWILH